MPTTYKFAPNVAVAADVKYIDIVPSEKGGPQIRLKGTIGGTENSVAYLPGKLSDQLAALIAGGIIANTEYPTEVDKSVEIKPIKRQFHMVKAQAAGEKYGTFQVVGAASAAVPATGNPAGAAGAHPPAPKSYTDLYDKATDFVIKKIIPKYKEAGLSLTGTDVKEMVATVFIPKSKE
jgi:hypothetical protein